MGNKSLDDARAWQKKFEQSFGSGGGRGDVFDVRQDNLEDCEIEEEPDGEPEVKRRRAWFSFGNKKRN